MNNTLFCLAFFLILFVTSQVGAACPKFETAAQPIAQAKKNDAEQPRFALLVGVTKYKNPEIKPLGGSANDVALLKDVLVNNFGFPDDAQHVKTLCTEEATRSAIITAFRDFLIANAKAAHEAGKEAIIVFHFSGHGSQYPDQDGDEGADHLDETILPYDTRTDGVFDILDDELDDLFAELSQYTANVTFILDSCHSGTASRGEFVAREADDDARERPPYKRKFPPTDETRIGKLLAISAAMPSQRAFERPDEFAGKTKNGELTYHLAAALRRATPMTTWRDLMREVAAAVRNEMPYQDANFEGGRADNPVFSGTALKKDASIEISEVNNELITFKAGRMQGVNLGAQVAIYDVAAKSFIGTENWLGSATVTDIRDMVSIAKLSRPNQKITKKSHLILTAPTFGGTPVSLVFDDPSLQTPSSLETTAAIRAQLKNNPVLANQLLEISETVAAAKKNSDRNSPVIRLKRGKFKDAFSRPQQAVLPDLCLSEKDLLPPPDTEIYYFDDGSGAPLLGRFFLAENKATPNNINLFLSNFAQYRNVLNVENTNSELSYQAGGVEAAIEIQPQILRYGCQNKDQTRKDAQIRTVCDGRQPQALTGDKMPQGAIYKVKIVNTSRAALYVTVLHLSNDGGISKIYPKNENTEPIEPGGAVYSTLQATAQPAGKETIKILIVKRAQDANFDFLVTPELHTKSDISLLGRLLTQSGRKTRDEGLPPDNPNSWGVVTLDYLVTDKAATCSQP